MIGKCTVVLSGKTDPYRNLAAEELLMEKAEADEYILFLWQNADTIVIGKNQNAWQECDAEAFRADGGRIARRRSGGGAVYHDMGNQNFTFIAAKENYDVGRQLHVIAEAVRYFGIPAEVSGRNDLQAEGRKFSGNAFYDDGTYACHHGTGLVSTDFSRMKKYLTPSVKKLEAKGVKSVESRVVNLNTFSSEITPEALRKQMIRVFAEMCRPAEFRLYEDVEELLDGGKLSEKEKQYASEEWIMQRQNTFAGKLEIRTERALVTIHADVENGYIRDVIVYSDDMDPSSAQILQEKLKGIRYRKDEIMAVLKQY
jgi:lipoate-protein ligase A